MFDHFGTEIRLVGAKIERKQRGKIDAEKSEANLHEMTGDYDKGDRKITD